MVFSPYLRNIILFVLALVVFALGLAYFIVKGSYPVSVSVFALLLAATTVLLIFYLMRTRKDLLRMIDALRHEDVSTRFSSSVRDPFLLPIHQGFNEIVRNFRLIRLDKEAEHHFFRATIDHIQFGMLAFDEDRNVGISNKAFREFAACSEIQHLEELKKGFPELHDILLSLPPRQSSIHRLRMGGQYHQVIFLASDFKLQEKAHKLVSMRDLSREIEHTELEAWKKLIRIMKHEILNSISPIKLLSGNIINSLFSGGKLRDLRELTTEEVEELQLGIETIHRRSVSLSKFVETYASLYQLPAPEISELDPELLFKDIQQLFREQLEEEKIGFSFSFESGSKVMADEGLLVQVLINLVRNAIDATSGRPDRSITLWCGIRDSSPCIEVSDNGRGIDSEQLNNIYIPFYSTKEEGSGIGLSFAQHVMKLHQGSLSVDSIPGKGSTFKMLFTGGQ